MPYSSRCDLLGCNAARAGGTMDAELTALFATAGTTLVQQLTTEVWEGAKAGFVALWRRKQPERADVVDAELTEARAGAVAARRIGDDEALAELADEWRSRLRRLVASDPDLVAELRRWTEQWAPSGDTSQVSMVANASGHGRITMAGRDMYLTES